jgi:peptide chain release factor 1
MASMIDKLNDLDSEFSALEQSLGEPELLADQARYRQAMRRYAELKPVAEVYREYRDTLAQITGANELAGDPEMGDLAQEELASLEPRRAELEERLERLLLPRDPFDDKSVIVEIRAAAGGDEASLFAAELLAMYVRYSEALGFRAEILDSNETEVGGLSKVSLEVNGAGAYSRLKFESGVHRVQRVPATETQGRIHTSTVTVAVLPEAEDVDVDLSPGDYRVDVFRSSGPGGQSVNTTDSAVRITYRPGTSEEIVVTCQDGKSQIKNKEKALTVLRARLLEREREKAASEAREARLVQIGTGERSEKIRTYNFPQSRITDHRIGLTTRSLSQVMAGDLSELTQALMEAEQSRKLDEMAEAHGAQRAGAQPRGSA